MFSKSTIPNQQYTLSLWIRSDNPGMIRVHGHEFNTSTEWRRAQLVFVASEENVNVFFPVTGTYYLYHSKLEVGNKATGWSPSPFDYTRTEDLADVALSGKYDDLLGKPSIPQSVKELDLEGTVLYKGDITQESKEDSQGNKYLETKVPLGNGEYITYATHDAGDYVVFGEIGEDAEGKDYFCLDKKGLLTARNAIIYGEIYATDGNFFGSVTAKDGFKVVDDNHNEVAFFCSDSIKLGANNDAATIYFCDDAGYIKSYEDAIGTEWKRILIGANHSVGLKSSGDIVLNTDYTDPDTGMNVSTTLEMISSRPWYGGLYTGEIRMALNYAGDDLAGSTSIDLQYDSLDIRCRGQGVSGITLKREGLIAIDGYVHFNDDIYVKRYPVVPICSGVVESEIISASSYRDVTISFPFSFSGIPNVVAGLHSSSSSAESGKLAVSVMERSANGAQLRIYNAGTENRAPALFWIATQN